MLPMRIQSRTRSSCMARRASAQSAWAARVALTLSADLLESTCFRIGLIAALRSKALGGKTIGLMVTASHNPERVRSTCRRR